MRNQIQVEGSGVNLVQLMQFPAEGIFTQILTKSESFSCALICLSTGNEIDRHSLNGKACLQILKGMGELVTDNARIELLPGSFLYLEEHAAHSIQARENLGFLFCLSHMIPRDLYVLKRGLRRDAA